jgi:histone demethylase JARID1
MYSINYHHKGAPKQWYGVPGTKHDADGVERVFKSYLSMKMRDVPDLLHHITTSFSPRLLNQEGVRVCKLLQHEGEFIVTFPRAFHGGFSLGPNCGEAVNFALQDWIPHAVDANERYRTFGRASVFSHDRLVYTMAHHIKDLRTKEICVALAKELRRLRKEELLLRKKLLSAGVRDVSKDVELPANRLDQLDEESADYDDKRLCHSCKHICFFSAVCCECSDRKVSCLRHSHYMCRCSIKRKYILIWTPESEMEETISRVEKRGEELSYCKPVEQSTLTAHKGALEDAGSEKDKTIYKTYEVAVNPICPIDSVPELVSSDTSMCSLSGDSSGALKDFPEKSILAPKNDDMISSTVSSNGLSGGAELHS